MPEIGTSGLMSGVGKRGGARRQYPRPTSTLPANPPPTHTPPQRGPASVGQTPWSARDPPVALLHLLPTPPPTLTLPHRAATVRERCLPPTSRSTPALP